MNARSALLLAAVLLLPTAAAHRGARGPLVLGFDLGPGDSPYLSGFWPEFEFAGRESLHWTRPEAEISLPLELFGPAEVALRFGPPPGGPSRVDVVLGDRPLGGFECCRHRALQRQTLAAALPAPKSGAEPPPVALRLGLRVRGSDISDRGLFLDRVDVGLAEDARVRLRGYTRYRPLVLVGLLAAVLWLAGFDLLRAALLSAPLSALLAAALLQDPWLVHRFLQDAPEALATVFVPLAALGRLPAVTRRLDPEARRAALTLATLAFLLRNGALHHPASYHPDLMVHARLVAVAREAGPRLWIDPRAVLYTPRETASPTDTLVRAQSGLWLRRLAGADIGLPYTLGLHALLAPFGRGLDPTIALLKTAGALFSVVPIVVLAFLGPRLGLTPWAAGLLVAAPTAFVELTLGMVPAAFGQALDALFILWLSVRGPRATTLPGIVEGGLLLAAAQLAYVSSVLTLPVLLVCAGVLALRAEPALARGLLGILALGSTVAVATYYRAFVPDAVRAVRLVLEGAVLMAGPAGAADPGGGRVDAAFLRFTVPLVALPAAFGLARVARHPRGRLMLAWALAWGLLALLGACLPGVFGFVHAGLFVTPLLVLCAAAALEDLRTRPGPRRLVALAAYALVVLVGFGLQSQALLESWR